MKSVRRRAAKPVDDDAAPLALDRDVGLVAHPATAPRATIFRKPVFWALFAYVVALFARSLSVLVVQRLAAVVTMPFRRLTSRR